MKVYYAPHIDLLFEQLRHSLTAGAAERDPFVPEVIITPNQNIASYVKIELARTTGIAINLEFPFPETALQNLYRNLKLYEQTGLKPARGFFSAHTSEANQIQFATQEDWQSVILHRLLSDSSAFFSKYLGDIPGVRERKAWALSRRLATYFREYRYHRPDFFLQNRSPFQSDTMQAAQLALLQQAKEDLGTLQLTDFFSAAQELPELVKLIPQKQTLRLFAAAQFSRFHTDLLLKLSQQIPMELYQIRFSEKFIQGHRFDSLLAKWTRASRQGAELIRNRGQQLNVPVSEISVQQSEQQVTYLADVKFLSATSLRQEVEQTAELIFKELAEDSSLGLSDIAVLAPDINQYWPHIQAVFHQRATPLTFNLSDASAAASSTYVKGALTLLELVAGHFSRENLFGLFYNPCFLTKFSLTRRTTARWFQWTEELDVYSGSTWREFYAAEKGARDWLTAVKRLRLGLVMDADPEKMAQYPLPHVPGWLDSRESLYTFCRIVEQLRSLHQQKTIAQAHGAALLEQFCLLLDDYLAIPEDRPLENEARRALQQACLREADRQRQLNIRHEFFTIATLKNLIKNTAEEIPLRLGRYLGGGISVSSLLPMRPVPFKIIFILGMEDDRFPRQSRHDSLDLRSTALSAQQGFDTSSDIDNQDADFQLFTEILSACKNRLYLSYRNIDIKKDIRLLAAQPYRDLQELLKTETIALLPDNQLTKEVVTASTADSHHNKKTELTELAVKDRDIINFLKFPLHFWLKRNNLGQSNDNEEPERRSQQFEPGNFSNYVKKNLISQAVYDSIAQGIFPNTNNFTAAVLQALDKKIQLMENSFRAPWGIFLQYEINDLRRRAELLSNSLQQLKINDWANFKRTSYGETDPEEILADRRPVWQFSALSARVSFSGLSSLYHWKQKDKQIDTIIFHSDDFVSYSNNPEKIHIKLEQHLSLMGVWLPLLPLLAEEKDVVLLNLISISGKEEIDSHTTDKNNKNFYKIKRFSTNFYPEQAFEYLLKLCEAMLTPQPPDAFHADALKNMQHPGVSIEAIAKYRNELKDIWRKRDSNFVFSLKYRNPIVDILPLWLREDMHTLIQERYEPLFRITIPNITEKDKQSSVPQKKGSRSK